MSLNVGVVINDLETLVSSQTTWFFAKGMADRGHKVSLIPAFRLGLNAKGKVSGQCVPLNVQDPSQLSNANATGRDLSDFDLILIRTNPGREERPGVADMMLMLLARVHREGVAVVNSPLGLWRASNKLYVAELEPDLRPDTLVTHEVDEARRFIASLGGRCVVKPVSGTRGRDVFLVEGPDSPNLVQIIEVIVRQGPVMVQSFVPEAMDGDIRVVLVDGKPLTVDGQFCAVRRRPGGSDFRSNIHAGGTAEPPDLTPAQIDVAHRVAAKLKEDGIALAGMDLIGQRVVEINVFSTGGYRDAERFSGLDFTGATLDWLESYVD